MGEKLKRMKLLQGFSVRKILISISCFTFFWKFLQMETLSLFNINLATILTETLNSEKARKLKIQTVCEVQRGCNFFSGASFKCNALSNYGFLDLKMKHLPGF